MSNKELKKYKAQLDQKLAEIAQDLRNRKDITVQKSPDLVEESQLQAEREMTIRSLHRDSRVLRQIKAALERIADETYGSCLQCEEDINPKRLAVVPWTSYCIRCQEIADRAERQDAGNHRSLDVAPAIGQVLAEVA